MTVAVTLAVAVIVSLTVALIVTVTVIARKTFLRELEQAPGTLGEDTLWDP